MTLIFRVLSFWYFRRSRELQCLSKLTKDGGEDGENLLAIYFFDCRQQELSLRLNLTRELLLLRRIKVCKLTFAFNCQ